MHQMNSWEKRAQLRKRLAGDCVMNSRRGPECAVGAMMDCVDKLLGLSSAVILAELTQLGLDQDSIGIILQEWTAARRHIYFNMVVKFSYWHHEPWMFFGLAHRNIVLARRCARRCIRLRSRLLGQVHKPIHYITRLLLFTEKLWAQLQDFANGRDMDELEDLKILAAMFRFAFTSENVCVIDTLVALSSAAVSQIRLKA